MSVLTPSRPTAENAFGTGAAATHRPARGGRRGGLLLAAPFALLLTATVLIPVGYAIYLSLFTDRLTGLGFSGPEQVFVWLENYGNVLTDKAFLDGVGHVALFSLIHIPLMLGGALVLALLLDSAVARLRGMWTLAVFLPYAVPGVIAGLIWAYLYSPTIGPLTDLLPFDPLGSDGALASIANMATWQWCGYNMIIFLTALRSVPREILEAARVDGAGPVRTALRIKVPVIRPTLFVALIFTVIGSLQLFTEPLVLHNFTGSVTTNWSPSLYVYDSAFINNEYGRAAAASIILALVSALLSALVMRLSTRRSAR
ncbi:sugar ABC transporter permease [Streptomyces luomodiensis]|uniref:Sugar ABC transporter permease n=1 Tax=Streptomyces luomodiensis TaxID=3026192 RepID=A0ABY9VA07_9ACTN|nr:sugar ABC transporter permease [Streptomyces sp. SCA4-21]WNF00831.1 sugar ABC transporter permease [Streptomyces sp. SCA4-21]